MNIGDLYGTLRADGSQMILDAQKAGDTAAGKAGDSFNSKFSKLLHTGAGIAFGLAFGAMATGANELDAATKKLMADTGMTADEAAHAEKAIAGMYQNNLQGFDQIGAAMAVVINGLVLTGTAADDMTQKFLTFATATGQDAAPAVSAFHEILNAWNLDASAAPAIMDKLTASHQKYGSSVTDNETALRTLAPQMQALGMNIDDTIGLLNLFDAAGMDSSKAMFALNTAVKNLKPGQTLNDLIKQVSSIEDPTLRAQEAIKLFGARGGVNLANALKPGIDSLDAFKTTAAENADATIKAADAIKSGFGNQVTQVLHQFGGALAELGTNFGPLIYASAALGPGITRAVTTALGGLIGLMFGQGAAAGASLVAGESAAVAVGGPAVAGAVAAQTGEVAAAGAAAGTAAGGALGTAMAVAIPLALIAVGSAVSIGIVDNVVDPILAGVHDALFGKESNDMIAQFADWLNTPIGEGSPTRKAQTTDWGIPEAAAQRAEGTIAAALKAGSSAQAAILAGQEALIAQAAKDGYQGIPTAAQAAAYEADLAIKKGLDDQVAAIKSSKSAFASAWTDALSAETDAATMRYREDQALSDIAVTEKALTNKKLTTLDRERLQAQLAEQRAAYAKLLIEDANYGTDAEKKTKLSALLQSKAMKDGLASTDPDTVALWELVKADTQTKLDELVGIYGTAGANAAQAFADALAAKLGIHVDSNGEIIIGGKVRGYAEGSDFVPYTQVAVVHKGERIIPADQNRALMAGSGLGATINIGGITLNGVGSDVSTSAARRFGQAVRDEIAQALQEQGSRFSEYSGARP